MNKIDQSLKDVINPEGNVLDRSSWLREESYDLALRIPHLDGIPLLAILILTEIAANGELATSSLESALHGNAPEFKEALDVLSEFAFIEETANGYKATPGGYQAFAELGKRMVQREHHELKNRLDQLTHLKNRLNEI